MPANYVGSGYTTYSGSADPYFRFKQLERLGGVAQLLMQQAQERKQREQQRLEQRIKLAASSVAAGGDISNPAVQGVFADLRAAAKKPYLRNEGYDKVADLLEANFQAQQNDPDMIEAKTRAAMLREMQDFQQSVMPPLAPPSAPEAYRHAVESTPGGAAVLAKDVGGSNLAKLAYPERYAQPDETPAAIQTDQYWRAELASGDPERVRIAKRHYQELPTATSVYAATQANTRAEQTAQRLEGNAELNAIRSGLQTQLADEARAWEAEASRRKTATGPDAAWQQANPRPTLPNVESLARKIQAVRHLEHLDEDQKGALEQVLIQAAKKGKLEAYWSRTMKNQRVVGMGSAGGG